MSDLFKNLPPLETKEETPTENASAEDTELPEEGMTELDMLKARAKLMGIQHSNNIGVDALREKINNALNGNKEEPKPEVTETVTTQVDTPVAEVTVVKKKTLAQVLKEENMKLIRVRVTNMDPKKKDLPGEIFTVANDYLGTVKKFVPYGEMTDNGYHIPNCIYKMLQRRKFLQIVYKTLPNGRKIQEHRMVKEFALEVLPPLTQDELNRLATAQIAAGSIEA